MNYYFKSPYMYLSYLMVYNERHYGIWAEDSALWFQTTKSSRIEFVILSVLEWTWTFIKIPGHHLNFPRHRIPKGLLRCQIPKLKTVKLYGPFIIYYVKTPFSKAVSFTFDLRVQVIRVKNHKIFCKIIFSRLEKLEPFIGSSNGLPRRPRNLESSLWRHH